MTPVEDEVNSHKEFLDTFFGSDDEGGAYQQNCMIYLVRSAQISFYRKKSIADKVPEENRRQARPTRLVV